MLQDIINASFEMIAGILFWLNIKQLIKDKEVKGVNIVPMLFFGMWSLWNLYYYPFLNQWWSFVGGISIGVANIVWIVLYFYYSKRTKQ